MYEGAKVNVNHPKGNPLAARDYQDRLGAIRNVTVREGQGLFGDLHFNPKHALAEQLLWDATNAPENVGFSHNVEARTSQAGGRTVVEAILKVQSVDLVADPATTRGLYEAEGDEAGETGEADQMQLDPELAACLERLTLEQLRTARPDLVEQIEADLKTQLTAVESQLDRLRTANVLHERRAAIARLLREYKLPDPYDAEGACKVLVSEQFVESLLAAPNEGRALAGRRAGGADWPRRGGSNAVSSARPTSREQYRGEPDRPLRREELRARDLLNRLAEQSVPRPSHCPKLFPVTRERTKWPIRCAGDTEKPIRWCCRWRRPR